MFSSVFLLNHVNKISLAYVRNLYLLLNSIQILSFLIFKKEAQIGMMFRLQISIFRRSLIEQKRTMEAKASPLATWWSGFRE